MLYHVYVGSYTDEKNADGIYQLELDGEKGKLRMVRAYQECDGPSFLAVTKDCLYAVSEREDSDEGMVSAFSRNAEDGGLTYLNSIPTSGTAMCHINMWPGGRYFSAANYMSGSVFTGSIGENGKLEKVCDFKQHTGVGYYSKTRQDGPHVHCTQLSEDGKLLYVADLGLDRLFCYEIGREGALTLGGEEMQIRLPKGEGPRHFVFRDKGKYLYLATELGNKVFAYGREEERPVYQNIQTIGTLPENYREENTAADIHFSMDGRFLYVSNRGMDSLVMYKVDGKTGMLELGGYYEAYGRCPRNFCITPDDKYILIANQVSGNIVLCERNMATGKIGEKADEVFAPKACFVTAVE
ncbi:MAG: lactonase family protein [Clostridium sp.]|nr:lactonase family protein [Clostridium sp.]